MSKTIEDIIKQANDDIKQLLSDSYVEKRATDLGFDARGARTMYISTDGIIIDRASQPSAEYYQGLEYVGREFVTVFGDWVLYKAGNSRIDAAIKQVFIYEEKLDDEFDPSYQYH